MSERVALAVNPMAAGGRAGAAIERIRRGFEREGIDTEVWVESSAPQLVATIRKRLNNQPRAVIAVGGDGTVHLVINELAGSSCPVGVIPVGTGNDIARSWGVPADEQAAISFAIRGLSHSPRLVDLGQATHGDGPAKYFAAVYSAGFDAVVNERANQMRFPRGSSRYTLALLAELGQLRPRRYELTIDGQVENTEALLVAVANGPSFGGGMNIVPDASIDDGLLDVFIVHPVGRREFLALYPRVFKGAHIGHPAVDIRRTHSLRVGSEGIVGYADGERLSPLPVEIRVAPQSLLVLTS